MEEKREPRGFVCTRVVKPFSDIVVHGSVTMPCSGCGRAVWVAPSSMKLYDPQLGDAIICRDCFIPNPDDNIAGPSLKMFSEMIATLGWPRGIRVTLKAFWLYRPRRKRAQKIAERLKGEA